MKPSHGALSSSGGNWTDIVFLWSAGQLAVATGMSS